MRDINTLLAEAQEAINQGSEQEWFWSLTDEEKALVCSQFNTFVKSLVEWIEDVKKVLALALSGIKGIYESLEYIQEEIKQAGS